MLPWIVVAWMRAIIGTFLFYAVFVFELGSCSQVFFFFGYSMYYGKRFLSAAMFNTLRAKFLIFVFLAKTLYSLNMVTKSYTLMHLTATQNNQPDDVENLTYAYFLLKCLRNADFKVIFLFIILCIVNCVLLYL
jgi:hypothetical protein